MGPVNKKIVDFLRHREACIIQRREKEFVCFIYVNEERCVTGTLSMYPRTVIGLSDFELSNSQLMSLQRQVLLWVLEHRSRQLLAEERRCWATNLTLGVKILHIVSA